MGVPSFVIFLFFSQNKKVFWIVHLELKHFTHIFHAVRYFLMGKRSMQHDTKMYLFLRDVTHFSLSAYNTHTHVRFNSHLLFTLQTQLYPSLTFRGGVPSIRALQTIVFHVSCCSSLCQKTVRWYLGNCGLWGREPDFHQSAWSQQEGGTSRRVSQHHIMFGSQQGKGLWPNQFI